MCFSHQQRLHQNLVFLIHQAESNPNIASYLPPPQMGVYGPQATSNAGPGGAGAGAGVGGPPPPPSQWNDKRRFVLV